MADLHVQAPAKINLHLEVLGLRPDGFHELAMVMQSLDLADELALSARTDGLLHLVCDQPALPTDGSNLILRAAEALRRRVQRPELGADLALVKRIPVGAGLAGGSSDAAATLLGLNQLWDLALTGDDLQALAQELGSDVPFCLAGGTQLCFGRGERLEPFSSADLPNSAVPNSALFNWSVLLIKDPTASVSTPWAYGRCRELRGDFYLERELDFEERRQSLRQGPLLAALAGERPLPPLRNDLQSVVEPEQASVRQGLALLRQADGALGVAMSGSGPSLFALFADPAAAEAARAQLAGALQAEGFESWCCRCSSMGVRLDRDAA
ncbi:4-(cytidine 5'-diphospho)-2-C-methyl-D-erythritol kinase [Synechococcus sp. CS-602]|uniref:4-(cytidine 5'-diphospho)-2-C-methyl-D-erythritol kinase n=1 Tax=Synechococcaceae TaxID=1890426 RepID=UPI0008FF4C78|nr:MULTISPECIES: 4-(cytidine 5'-diphospho)-2-C-methyl-D-erythritol kinase [Synechococcaceae]MCT4363575.1 4-(cytidine 5'-diphospho)-2-C-methyl-D-erythritol kinase [Candidatus Regnicoccus frigidus MAG-AL1]APD48629.1 4-(cytidine 5'-diphospho)-2-C-methyl-D-erythritol kinase [Synechococcus sp. SynAce01]MCT0202251.1 4-(cytidine 5'-diphospho)-2-C-methyl-D-erythritol kinase [Synechococcus sp. CS-603]MCT0205129.1 4-(cytidine 5'-diphospho)-2-C-methyl-D-erythritol kinase [Synechococcus sp. CS-602]MCT0245